MYTSDQIGEIRVEPINARTQSQFSLILIQKDNEQVLVLEPCSWNEGRKRTVAMVRGGIDPFDIRFVFRERDHLTTDGLPLRHVNEALWWTSEDQREVDAELAHG